MNGGVTTLLWLVLIVLGVLYAGTLVGVDMLPSGNKEEYTGQYWYWYYPRYYYRPYWSNYNWRQYSYGYPWYWRRWYTYRGYY